VAPALRPLGTTTATRGAAALTQREVEVITLLVHEKSSKEIAELLRISPSTVATHRTSIMRKLDIHTATGLLRYALRAGIVRDGP
jgi:DNA-binding NarL/FixJ family response regulator